MNKKLLWVNLLIPIFIYLIGLGVAIGFSLNVDYTATSDSMREYSIYADIVKTGQWKPIPGNTLTSCVIIVYLPAMLQRLIGTDMLLTYKVIHSIMVSFLPVVVYLLAKNYVGWKYACISTGLFLAHPYSMWEPMVARLSVALIFFVLIILITFSTRLRTIYKIPLLAVCSLGIVMSHYGGAYVSLFILGGSWLVIMFLHFIKKATFRHKKDFAIALCSLIVAATFWLGIVENTPWRTATGFVDNSLSPEHFDQNSESIVTDAQNIHNTPNVPNQIEDNPSVVGEFFNLDNREWAIQAAFGRTLPTANVVQKAEFVFSWLVILTLIWGLVIAVKKKMFSKEYLVIIGVCYFTILVAATLPHVSINYSAFRVYFQALVVIGVYFVVGGAEISKALKLKPVVIPLFVLIPYILCTSNILHQFIGSTRWDF